MSRLASVVALVACGASVFIHVPATARMQAPSPQTAEMGRSWDDSYRGAPGFNPEPNGFLIDVVKALTPGTALDVGMGQGRNAVYLAKLGWTVTGFDVSQVGIEQAQHSAKAAGVRITALQQSSREFDWGTEKWDLVVLTYFPGLRASVPKILQGLRPGGHVIVEAYQADAALTPPGAPGPGVTFGDNELLTVFSALRTLRYEDLVARADWGMRDTRVVRLLARKK